MISFSENFKARAVKIAVPFLLEKFEPAIMNVANAKKDVVLAENEIDVVVMLRLNKDNICYASTVVISNENVITRVLDDRPFKELLMSLIKF